VFSFPPEGVPKPRVGPFWTRKWVRIGQGFPDNRKLKKGRYRGIFKVWVNADKIKFSGIELGVFVVFHVISIDEATLGAVIAQAR
jgi:hypothetical protein